MQSEKTEASNYFGYIATGVNDAERLILQHKILEPGFAKILQKVFDEYGLTNILQKANSPIRILDIGCNEGLFLQDVATELEKRGLLGVAKLQGVDINAKAIESATANSPTYLDFALLDITNPLENWPSLAPEQFDFVYLTIVMEHLPSPRQQLAKIYQLLKPGGILYLRSAVLESSEKGWVLPHPAMNIFMDAFIALMSKANGGEVVARKHADWLLELGAERVKTLTDIIPIGGESELGVEMLRNTVWGIANSSSRMITYGLLSQQAVDDMIEQLTTELQPQAEGHMTFIDTLARKPLNSL